MTEQINELAEAIAEGMRAHEIEKHFHNVVQVMIQEMSKEDVDAAKYKALDILNREELIGAEMTNTTLH